MAHRIEDIDVGFVSGSTTWHGLPQFVCVGDRAVTVEEAAKTVDFEIEKRPTFVKSGDVYIPTGGYSIVRPTASGDIVLAAAVGARYVATHHREVLNGMVENLLATFPTLKICGTGTLSSGASWFIQLISEKYFIKGDNSPNEQRLTYTQTYGQTSHIEMVTTVRIVCANTRRMALTEAASKLMLGKHRHPAGAVAKINAGMEAFAQLHMGVEKDKELMEQLGAMPATVADVKAFLDEFIPLPQPAVSATTGKGAVVVAQAASSVSLNRANAGRDKVVEIFEGGQLMDGAVRTSRYALLNAYTDWVDHASYSRRPEDRWMDSLGGERAKSKEDATAFLLKPELAATA